MWYNGLCYCTFTVQALYGERPARQTEDSPLIDVEETAKTMDGLPTLLTRPGPMSKSELALFAYFIQVQKTVCSTRRQTGYDWHSHVLRRWCYRCFPLDLVYHLLPNEAVQGLMFELVVYLCNVGERLDIFYSFLLCLISFGEEVHLRFFIKISNSEQSDL